MIESPRWLIPADQSFHAHQVLNVHEPTCNALEPLMKVLSFGRVTTFSIENGKWVSKSEDFVYNGWETAAKIALWAVSFMLVIPGIVFLSLKYCYLEKIKEFVKSSYIQELYSHEKTPKMDIIAEVVRDAADHARIVIDNTEGSFQCSAHGEWMASELPGVLLAHVGTHAWQSENRQTIEFFFNQFERARCRTLFKMMGIDIDYLYNHGLPLTRRHVVLFLALTGFVHVRDMHAIANNLRVHADQNQPYLHLSREEVQRAASILGKTNFEKMNQKQYDLLWDIMTPLRFSTMFIDKIERVLPDQNRGCELHSIIRALWIEHHHIREHWDQMTQRDCDYTLIKSIVGAFSDRVDANIKGKVIRQKKGYGFLRNLIFGAGCYCIPMEAMGATRRETLKEERNGEGKYREDTYLSRLLFLPTQACTTNLPQKWESLVGILHSNIGAKGVLALWPRLKEEILDRGESFRRVDIIGYSQGGTQAAKAATLALHGGYVRKLTKVCGTGEDLATAQFFAEMIDAKDPGERRYAFKARSIWQPDDRTHLAEDCELTIEAVRADQNRNPRVKQKIHWYSSTEVGEEKLQKPHAPGYSAQIVSEAFLSVVGGPHAEDVVADGHPYVYSTSTVTERGEVLAQLDNRPLEWEPTRKGLSSAIYGQSQSYFVDHARILLNGSDDL